MRSLETRVDRLEQALGKDDMDRWIRSLTDEELDVQIANLRALADAAERDDVNLETYQRKSADAQHRD
jgi:hypothetical protein